MKEHREGRLPRPSLEFYFGGKSAVADIVWAALGNVTNYTEPFFGSGAVLLARAQPFEGVETVNDADGLICNFWRAVQAAPDDVARYADHPCLENDLHARHYWLVNRKDSLQSQLEGDPDFFDAKTAGWWLWGMCLWIGGGFCSGKGPWLVVDGELVKGGPGEGIKRALPHIFRGRGIIRKLPHIFRGRGIIRKLPHIADAGHGINRIAGDNLYDYMHALADRLRRVRVCCGDWTRVCGGKDGNALASLFAGGTTSGIFLDPPYSDEANRDQNLYRMESGTVAHDAREWALAHGDDKNLRIILCGYEGEHDMPGWRCIEWKAQGGYANQADDAEVNGKANRHRERLWLSPGCLDAEDLPLFQE